MNRKQITEHLQSLLEEKMKKMKKEGKKGKKPYVEDADIDDDKEDEDEMEEEDSSVKKHKKLRQDKGAYSKLSSTGVADSTVAEEQLEEAIDPKIQKEIDAMKRKKMNDIEILMAIDKKHGSKLSKKELEKIAAHLSDD